MAEEPRVLCKCKQEAEKRVSKTEKNPDRVFYVCAIRSKAQKEASEEDRDGISDGCDYWKWQSQVNQLENRRRAAKRKIENTGDQQNEQGQRANKRAKVASKPDAGLYSDLQLRVSALIDRINKLEAEVAGLQTRRQVEEADEEEEED